MKIQDYFIFFGLAVLAVFIWFRDTAWMTTSDDTLPIIVALPLFVWLGAPWMWSASIPNYSRSLIVSGTVIFIAGIGLNITFFLAMGWVILLAAWLNERLQKETLPTLHKLFILPLISFPWISLDLNRAGWWFRLSGAWISEYVFTWMGFAVERQGTFLNIDGINISIEVACAGLNTLQSMLISGCIVAFILLKDTPRYWLSIPVIIFMAWTANTIRIIVICLLALLISPAFVMGPFHIWGAWGVLMLMFALCWLVFSLLEPKQKLDN